MWFFRSGRHTAKAEKDIFDYYSDIHPKTEKQYNDQQYISGIVPGYRDWMVGRSSSEKSQHTRDYYNIKWSDITYPWLSDISGGNGNAAVGKGMLQFSRNMTSLYRSGNKKRSKKRRK